MWKPWQSPMRPLLAGFVLVFAVQTAFFSRGRFSSSGVQPTAFNHSKHIAAGLTCTDCHAGARTEQHAGIPELATCVACHAAPLGKSVEEAKLRAFAAAGNEIPWRPVSQVPAHVYFSHRRHVALARIECVTCHGAMEKLTAPPRVPYRPLSMDYCIECHTKNQARGDCNDCHR